MRVSALFVLVAASVAASAQNTTNGTSACLTQCSQQAAQNSTSDVKEKLAKCIKDASSLVGSAKCICNSDIASPFESCLQQTCPNDKASFDTACKALSGSPKMWDTAGALGIGSAGLLLAGLVLLL